MSWAQDRFRILEELTPGTTVWQIEQRYRLRGPLDVTAFELALRDLHERHHGLRTRVVAHGDRFYQEATSSEPELSVLDLRDDPDRDARIEALLASMSRPFAFETGPLWRAAIVRIAADESFLFLRFHHLIIDANSLAIVHKDLAALYTARRLGQVSDLPPLTRDYADYAAWQRGPSAAAEHAPQIAYWTKQLGDAQALELPTDRRRTSDRARSGGAVRFALAPDVVAAMSDLCKREEATLFMGLLAAFELVLARYCGINDVAVAIPVADSRDRDTRGVIGPFINTMVVRTDFDGAETFVAALHRVRDVVIDGLENKDVPLEHVLRALRRTRGGNAAGLNVMFSMPPLRRRTSIPDLVYESMDTPPSHVGFELELMFLGEDHGALLIYDADLFDRATVERMAGHYHQFIARVIAEPTRSLASIDLLDDEERAQLEAWNATTREVNDQTIYDRIAQQVARSPDAIAVAGNDVSLTYRELAERTERVAGWLASRGVSRGHTVVVSVERSVDMVVAVLAVLRAGAAYVPIDPDYPASRREYIRTNACAVVELTDATLREAIACTTVAPFVEVTGDDPAYVLYTSGSTGNPKGVCVPQRAVTNFVASMQRAPGIASTDTLLAVTTLSFDIAGLEIYLPLTAGAKVVVASSEQTRDPEQLAALIATSGATIMQATPATWRMLLSTGWRPSTQLRVLCGGEALPPDLAASLAPLWNLYGPTETTIWSTCTKIEPGQSITIGRPIDNTRIYVVDAALCQTPIGVAGELCIGGSGLAHGYFSRADLTAEKFVADPFSREPGARMYRTGDRARWRSDGSLEHLGRLDHQVKVRGFRIELGEIESVLRELVRDVVVIVREDRPGDPRIVAYVVGAPDIEQLRDHARSKLPDYMVPSAIVVLDALPLTPNAKIDRRALPAPDGTSLVGTGYVAARTPEEQALVRMWQDVLAVPRVGIHDDFFAIGGHSLLAIRLLGEITRAFPGGAIQIPLVQLFRTPTIAGLATEILARRSKGQVFVQRPVLTATAARKAKVVAPQRGTYRLGLKAPMNLMNRLNWSSWFDGPLDAAALSHAFDVLRQRHDLLRVRFFEEDGATWQELLEPPRPFTLERVDLTAIPASEQQAADRAFQHEFAQRPFDLAAGEVMRASLVTLSPSRHRLTFSAHRVVCDDESKRLLIDELMRLWRAFTIDPAGESAPAASSRQYLDLADYLARFADSDAGAQQRAFWNTRLANVQALELPVDRPRDRVDARRTEQRGFVMFPAGFVSSEIGRDVLGAVEQLARGARASIMSTLLAAMASHLSALSGQTDLVIVSHLIYRHMPGLEHTIGLFANPLMMRISNDGAPPFRELIARTQEAVSGAFENGECDVIELAPPQLFRLWFNYLYVAPGSDSQAFELPPGLTATPGELPSGERQIAYDVIVFVRNTGDSVKFSLAYNLELFTEAAAQRMLDGYVAHLHSLVTSGQRSR
ncbi:MAG TPA: amino acid adenylation domain-containing protein [Kofleriaceae bacterium]